MSSQNMNNVRGIRSPEAWSIIVNANRSAVFAICQRMREEFVDERLSNDEARRNLLLV